MKGAIRAGIIAGAMLALVGCGEDTPEKAEKINPLEATKWLSDNGYEVNQGGLVLAITKDDRRAMRYLAALDSGGKNYAGEVFVFTVGQCMRLGHSFYTADECKSVAQLFLDAGVPIDATGPWRVKGGTTLQVSVFDVLEMPYKDLTGGEFRDAMTADQRSHIEELAKARPAVLEFLKKKRK